jgi:hypothetical protein
MADPKIEAPRQKPRGKVGSPPGHPGVSQPGAMWTDRFNELVLTITLPKSIDRKALRAHVDKALDEFFDQQAD